MLHEMLTGTRPFIGNTPLQLLSSILRDEPRSAAEIRLDAPDALSHLIQRCLEKRPEGRVQTARDIYHLRQRARAPALAISRRRFALNAAARAGPPFRPPSRPSAAACGFGSCGTLRRRSTSTRSVGAWQRVQEGPMRSSNSGSVLSSTKSQTRQRRTTVTNVVECLSSLEGMTKSVTRNYA